MPRADKVVPDGNGFITAEELAKRLRVSVSWVYKWTRAGKIPCTKFGSLIRFDEATIQKWIAAHKIDGGLRL